MCEISKISRYINIGVFFVYFVGTAMVLAKMPHDKISEGLKELCTPQVTPFNRVLQNTPT